MIPSAADVRARAEQAIANPQPLTAAALAQ
jgi:hypothetical protein